QLTRLSLVHGGNPCEHVVIRVPVVPGSLSIVLDGEACLAEPSSDALHRGVEVVTALLPQDFAVHYGEASVSGLVGHRPYLILRMELDCQVQPPARAERLPEALQDDGPVLR